MEQNAALILGIKDHVEDLVKELRAIKTYLSEAARNESWKDNAVLVEVEQSIRNVGRDAEDVIDKYIVERRNHKAKPTLKRWADKASYYTKVNLSAREIESIKERAKKIRQDYAHPLQLLQGGLQNNHHPAVLQRFFLSAVDGGGGSGGKAKTSSLSSPELRKVKPQPTDIWADETWRLRAEEERWVLVTGKSTAAPVEEDDVVGFDDEAKTIKDRLTEKSKDTTFISIVGMAGLGKTTLTKMVFNDTDIQYEFFTRLWVYVSRTMNRRQIFMDIISRFTKQIDVFKNVSEELLAESIKEYLKGGKYFIVMDDVWHKRDWDLLKIAFPNNLNGSRVLVTTRDTGVAKHADSYAKPHNLKFLKDEESLELLKKKVYRKEAFPEYLETPGRRIAAKCNGLPLALVVIAGVLDKDDVSSWNEVAENPIPILNRQTQDYNDILRLSYNQLSNHTKNCFLYLAAFPMGYEISVWKLIRLWIAEGFIPSEPDSTMERTADSSLKEIVSKNLLMVMKRRADGHIKTCRLHDTLHEFCKDEAVKNYLFHEINGERIEANDNYRRLCIRSSVKDFIGSEDKPSGEHIRSLLASQKLDVPKEHLATIPKAYPFLKVFDVENLKFEILPKEFYQLYYLRYLAISTDLKILPKPFTNQWNMETLVFNTTQSSIDVKAEIWKLTKLRHIIANASLHFPTPQNSKDKCKDLQTLSPISPKSCTEAILEKMPSLLKLGVRGNLVELLESKGGVYLFDNVWKLHNLQNLKLVHEPANDPSSTIRDFPNKFPLKLRKLTLSNTSIDWKHICALGSLNELEVLKLKESAVKGEYWELNNSTVFKRLRFLRIGRTNLVRWTCEKTSFPALNKLCLSHCTSLEAVPLAFKDVKSLKVMELFCTNKNVAASARTIQKEKQADGFDLSIYPPADN
nr:putative late blight resistance protein homolog R1B-14 [Ipomoea batatas]